jgi:hypothetical protein
MVSTLHLALLIETVHNNLMNYTYSFMNFPDRTAKIQKSQRNAEVLKHRYLAAGSHILFPILFLYIIFCDTTTQSFVII